jgi:hypothetical protein
VSLDKDDRKLYFLLFFIFYLLFFVKGDLCQWRILATHGEKIVLNITSLDIPASVNCQLDYLEASTFFQTQSIFNLTFYNSVNFIFVHYIISLDISVSVTV